MASDLAELHERLDHCGSRIEDLNKRIYQFVDRGVEIRPNHSILNPGVFTIIARVKEQVPVSIRSDAGTIANEMRSVLDALACRLAERHAGNSNSTYFPISRSFDIFDTDGRKKMRKLSPADKATIEGLQPWGDGHPVLFRLHEADRVRKHQKLLGCAGDGKVVQVGNGYIGNLQMGGARSAPATEVGQTTILATGRNVASDITVAMTLVYTEQGPLYRYAVNTLMLRSHDAVARIVSLFD